MYNKILIGIILIFIIIVPLSLMIRGLNLGHDVYAHLTYGKLFYQAFSEGQFPVRWTESFREGYSSPLFNFYQVGFYYLVAFFQSLNTPFIYSIKLSILFLWWFGTFFTYLFARRFGNLIGAISALVYSFSPYIILDIFVRASYPEFMALSFMPSIFWGVDKLITTLKIRYIGFLSIFLAVAVYSHLPSVLIFSPIILGFALLRLFHKRNELVKKFSFLSLSLLLGLGLASSYLLPAIFELKYINISNLTSDAFDFRKHFVSLENLFTYVWGYNSSWMVPVTNTPLLMGITQWTIFANSAVTLFKSKSNIQRTYLIFWIFSIFYVLFFMNKGSLFIWENVKALSYIQFPWRFFMVIPFASSIIAGILFSTFNNQSLKSLFIGVVLILNFMIYMSFSNNTKMINTSIFNLDFESWVNNKEIQKAAYFEEGYTPKGTENIIRERIPHFSLNNKYSHAKQIVYKNTYQEYIISSESNLIFTDNTHYFPGWKAYLNDHEIKINPTNNEYFMQVNIPRGESKLVFKFEDTFIRSISNKISLVSLIIIGLIFVFGTFKKSLQNLPLSTNFKR